MNNNSHLLVAVCLVCFFGFIIKSAAWAGGGSDLEKEPEEHEFLTACQKGDEDNVRHFLDLAGFAINQLYPREGGKQPVTGLYLAAGYGHHLVLKMLLKAGADPNIKVDGGRTPLMNAAEIGHMAVVDTLIKHGADVHVVTEQNDSAIYMASKGGHDQLVQSLMDAGAKHPLGDASKPILKNTKREHKFLAACREGHIGVIRYYLKLADFDINQLYTGGAKKEFMTGLYLAAGFGHHLAVKMLLKAGADPNIKVYGGRTPLINAAEVGHAKVVETLIAYKADIHAITDNNESAIYMASKGGYDQLVQYFMDAGAKHPKGDASQPILKNIRKEHEFLAACREGHIGVIRHYLKLAGFDINQLYTGGIKNQLMTGLYLAAGYGRNSVVKMLLQAGADPNKRIYNGETPLMNAAAAGHTELVKVFIESQADTEQESNSGDTALSLAKRREFHEVVTLLLAHGVAPHKTIQGKYVGQKALSEAKAHKPDFFDFIPKPYSQNYRLTQKTLTQAMKTKGCAEVRSYRSRIQSADEGLRQSPPPTGNEEKIQSLPASMAGLSVTETKL